jgi:ketosteroid isomerase-like protein
VTALPDAEAVAVVRAFFEVAAEDDEGLSASLDPDVVWFGTRGGLDEAQVLRGPEAVLEYMREIREPWEQYDFQVERLIEIGDGGVVVFMHETAQSRHGGPAMQSDTAMIMKVRHRKIVEMTGYLDRDEAVRAAGLEV